MMRMKKLRLKNTIREHIRNWCPASRKTMRRRNNRPSSRRSSDNQKKKTIIGKHGRASAKKVPRDRKDPARLHHIQITHKMEAFCSKESAAAAQAFSKTEIWQKIWVFSRLISKMPKEAANKGNKVLISFLQTPGSAPIASMMAILMSLKMQMGQSSLEAYSPTNSTPAATKENQQAWAEYLAIQKWLWAWGWKIFKIGICIRSRIRMEAIRSSTRTSPKAYSVRSW